MGAEDRHCDAAGPAAPLLGAAALGHGAQPARHRHRVWARYLEATNGLTPLLFAMYFLIAFAETMPLTAVTGWLKNDIGMTVEETTNYYALTFLPWVIKPIYGWLADHYPIRGRSRGPYLVVCGLGSSVCYLLLSAVVTTVAGAFAVTFCRAICNAFAELLIGLSMVDAAARNPRNTGAIQAMATGARNVGSLAAYFAAAAMYPCGHSSHSPTNSTGGASGGPPDRRVIGLTAIGPAVLAALALALPEPPRAKSRLSAPNFRVMIALQVLFVWVGIRDMIGFELWWKVLLGLAAAVLMVMATSLRGLLMHGGSNEGRATPRTAATRPQSSEGDDDLSATPLIDRGARRSQRAQVPSAFAIVVAMFVFLYNAAPDSSEQLSLYEYSVFENDKCKLQWLGIIGSVCSILASISYGALFNKRSSLLALAVTSVCAGALGLSSIPFAQLAQQPGNGTFIGGASATLADAGADPRKALQYAVLARCVTGFFGQLTFIPLLVLITDVCSSSSAGRGASYGIYLMVLNFGDVVSGFATAPLITRFGISYSDWSRLPELIYTCTACRMSVLTLITALVIARRHDEKKADLSGPSEDDLPPTTAEAGEAGAGSVQ